MDDHDWRLSPSAPIHWLDADRLRIGVDAGAVTVPCPSAELRRLIDRLRGESIRAPDARTALQRAIQTTAMPADLGVPVRAALTSWLERVDDSAAATRLAVRAVVSDSGQPLTGLFDALSDAGLFSLRPGSAPPELVIRAIRYLEPLEWTQRWLIAGVPHLPIRFSDRSIAVGPLVSPQGSPCHTCDALGLVAADPALPSLSAQLWGSRPATEHADGARLAVAHAIPLLRAWRNGDRRVHREQLVLRFSGAAVTVRRSRVSPHPRCDCGVQLSPPPPRRTATARRSPGPRRTGATVRERE